jgi:hypothetical protein
LFTGLNEALELFPAFEAPVKLYAEGRVLDFSYGLSNALTAMWAINHVQHVNNRKGLFGYNKNLCCFTHATTTNKKLSKQ